MRTREERTMGWPAGEEARRTSEIVTMNAETLPIIQRAVRSRKRSGTYEDRYGHIGEDSENYDNNGKRRQ